MIVLTLPYPISANRYWRPVNLGKHISIVPTKEAKQYREQRLTDADDAPGRDGRAGWALRQGICRQ